jgi:hypothetical protein
MRTSIALAALLALATSGSAHAFTAPFPNKAQQKAVTAQIQKQVARTAWYKGLIGAGMTPKLTVSYAYGKTPTGFIGAGFPIATAIVSAGKSIYGGGGLEPQKERQYTVTEGTNGKFRAAPEGKWQQLMTIK